MPNEIKTKKTFGTATIDHFSSVQNFLDRIIYRIAGLTDDEARGLEERLAKML